MDKTGKKKLETSLFINGKEVDLNPFVNDILGNGVLGMISSLKGIDMVYDLELKVRVKSE